jgi:hypothetical protein
VEVKGNGSQGHRRSLGVAVGRSSGARASINDGARGRGHARQQSSGVQADIKVVIREAGTRTAPQSTWPP